MTDAMGKGASKQYDQAKRKYNQKKGLLASLLEDIEKEEELKQKKAQKYVKKLGEKMIDVNETWEKVEEKRNLFLDEADSPEEGEEKWGDTETHSFTKEAISKEKMIDNAEETIEELNSLFDEDADNSDKIQTTLSSVSVSRNDMVEIEKKLADQLVDTWEKDSQCKVFRGIQKAKYSEFLELFQKTTGIDDSVKAAFGTVGKGYEVHDKLKAFKCKGTGLSGKKGLYAVVDRPNEDDMEKVDVAYSVFTFKTDLIGVEKPGVPVTIDGKMINADGKDISGENRSFTSNRALTVRDINSLTQNFIVAKALSGFADAGVITAVRYTEDNPPIEGCGVQALTL